MTPWLPFDPRLVFVSYQTTRQRVTSMKGKGKGKSNLPAQNANRAKAAATPSPPFIPRAKCSTMFHNTSDNSATTNKPEQNRGSIGFRPTSANSSELLTDQYKIKTTHFDRKMKDVLPSNICVGYTSTGKTCLTFSLPGVINLSTRQVMRRKKSSTR